MMGHKSADLITHLQLLNKLVQNLKKCTQRMVLGGYRAKVVTARNDPRINHHHLQLQGWRANRDMNIIIDYHSCVEYLTKYTSKAEKLSSVARNAFVSVITNHNPQNDKWQDS